MVGGVRPGVEGQRRAEEERHHGRADGHRHVHGPGVPRHQHVGALEERAEPGDRAPAAGVDGERAERRRDLVGDGTVATSAAEEEAGADRGMQGAGERDEMGGGPAPDRTARAELEGDEGRSRGRAGSREEIRGPAPRVGGNLEEEPLGSGGDARHPLVVVDQVERRLAAVEAARGKEPRPGMRDQPMPVGAHRPAARIGRPDQAQQHGAHLRARVVERQVEAFVPESLNGVVDEPVGGAEAVAGLADQHASQPVEIELPHPVDGRQPARHVSEVPLDQRDQLGVGMVLAQPDDRGRGLQEVAEAGEIDDEDLPHARCSRT